MIKSPLQWLAVLGLVPFVAMAFPGYAQNISSSSLKDLDLTPGFQPDPLTLEGISGGREPTADIAGVQSTPTGPCVGFVDEQPDHEITLQSDFNFLALEVESQRDTILLLRGPGGVWCNDDSVGHNPRIAGEWLAGEYRVWVGSYAQGSYYPYTLYLYQNE